MSELLKSLLGLINPVGAQREQINLLSLEKSQLISLVGEMQSHIADLVSEIKALKVKDASNTQEIEKLNNLLHQLNSFEPNTVNQNNVPYFSAAKPRRKP